MVPNDGLAETSAGRDVHSHTHRHRHRHSMDASSGQGLVPTKFVWRLGGSHVFLCGSFTRWVETVRVCV